MPNKLGITPGEWKIADGTFVYALMEINIRGRVIEQNRFSCFVQSGNKGGAERGELEANAALIAEAGTVANETGLTPRQLKEQRDELLGALEAFLDATEGTACVEAINALGGNAWPAIAEAGAKARSAIARATGK